MNELWQEVVRLPWDGNSLTVDLSDVDSKDFLLFRIDHYREIKWVRVLVIIGIRAPISKTLLQASIKAEALVGANGPTVKVDLVDVVDADLLAYLDHLWISASDSFTDVQILQCQNWHYIMQSLTRYDSLLRETDDDLGDVT